MKTPPLTLKETLSHSVELFFSQWEICRKTRCIVLALSGGADSVCLFHLFREVLPSLKKELVCAHVHHGLRAETADRDEAFCRALCEDFGVEFRSFSVDTPALKQEGSLSTEEAARILRYRVLLDFCKEKKALLATAHTASDQTESVLMAISRGGGVRSVGGIDAVRRDGVIRPLLTASGEETRRFCKEYGHSFVEDETNECDDYLRNFYRHRVANVMREKNPALDLCVSRTAKIARAEHEAFEFLVREKLQSLGVDRDETFVRMDVVRTLLDTPALRAVLYELCRRLHFNAGAKKALSEERFDALCRLLSRSCARGRRLQTGDGFSFFADAFTLSVFHDSVTEPSDVSEEITADGKTFSSERFVLCLSEREKVSETEKIHKIHTSAALDRDRIVGKLFVRTPCVSDTYTVRGRTRRVFSICSARRIPLVLRYNLPVLCDEAGIVWIPGELAADRVRAEQGSAVGIHLVAGELCTLLRKRRQYE